MAKEGSRAIKVRDYRRSVREFVVNIDTGEVLRAQRPVSNEVSGMGKKQHGEAVLVYKYSNGISDRLVLQHGRTKLDLSRVDCAASISRSFFGLRSSVRVSSSETSLSVSQWNVVSRVMSVLDPTWDALDEDSEDFVGWLKGVVDDADVRAYLLEVWAPANEAT